MDFTTALAAAFHDNDRVTRRHWNNRSIYAALEDGMLMIKGFPDDGLWHPWMISEQDFFADDWEIVMEA